VSVRQFIFAPLCGKYEYCHIKGSQRHGALHPEEWRRINWLIAEGKVDAIQSDPRGHEYSENDHESRAADSRCESLNRPLEWTRSSIVLSPQPRDRLDRLLDVGQCGRPSHLYCLSPWEPLDEKPVDAPFGAGDGLSR
jgi:hypothetical protein